MQHRIPLAEFIVSAVSERDFPRESLPEVVVAGRSNVGKSSLINSLVKNKRLARTSATPGKTQSINFYRLEGDFFLVDLPGFGYSTAGKAASLKWKKLIESYFRHRSTIALVIHLVDARMPPTALDHELAGWLKKQGTPRMIVATKADKLSGNQKAAQVRVISDALGSEPVTLISSRSGLGCKEVWNRMIDAIRRP